MAKHIWKQYDLRVYYLTDVNPNVTKYTYCPSTDNDNREITYNPAVAQTDASAMFWIKAGKLCDYIGAFVFDGGWWKIGPERHVTSNDYGSFLLTQATVKSMMTQNNYIGEVVAEEGTYPTNGQHGNYWYVDQGLANHPPIIPTNIICQSRIQSKHKITISWTNSTDSDNDPITYYIEYFDGTQWIAIGNTTSNTFDYTVPDVKMTNAKFRVRAYDGQAYSDYSESNVFEIVRIQISMNIDSRIREFSNGYVKIDGTLKNMSNVYIKVNDTLKEI